MLAAIKWILDIVIICILAAVIIELVSGVMKLVMDEEDEPEWEYIEPMDELELRRERVGQVDPHR